MSDKEIIETTETVDEAALFWADPKSASPEQQKNYIGCTFEEWQPIKDYTDQAPEGFEKVEKTYKNPFTGEDYKVNELVEIHKPTQEEMQKEIDERIAYLKYRVVQKKATTAEKDELKLLTL